MRHDQKPVVLLETSRGSDWGSCLTIMPNLAQAYREAEGSRVITLDYGRHCTANEILRCAQKIEVLDPSHLIFLDHQKHPLDLFNALAFVYGRKRWPTLVFHLYGDFTLFTELWAKSESQLRGRDVHFVCASPRQAKLVSSFVRNAKTLVSVCPFPISNREFRFVEGLKEKERTERGIAADEFVMLYTGRLSLQKNVLKMVWDLEQAAKKLNRPWRLLLAGTFDDIGKPFFGLQLAPGSYSQGFEKLIKEMSPESQKRIEYLGPLGKPELLRAYNAADLFVSFSTHHDEDYGMSPIEALACGTRALISDWGGFSGFAIDSSSVSLIPVELTGTGARVDTRNLSLEEFAHAESDERRRSRSQLYLNHFSIEAAAEIVRKIVSSAPAKFSAFTPFLKKHAQLLRQMEGRRAPFSFGKKADSNYINTYKNYIAESKDRK